MTKFTIEVDITGDYEVASRAIAEALANGTLTGFVTEATGGVIYVEGATVTDHREFDGGMTRFTLELDIEGDAGVAAAALDDAFDADVLQNGIRDAGAKVDRMEVVDRRPLRRR